ncbi:MAG: Rpn family recombination-promoting nuclease/putative transposase [Gammaproteobacteria bacterium]|nr:Rpn family recombination-promoting nuclease/putative transposase [Gammaproteobacteria bacterium]
MQSTDAYPYKVNFSPSIQDYIVGIIRTQHDKFVKSMMQHPEVARDFFNAHLSPEILEKMDLSTIKMEAVSFIDPELREHESDLIFSTDLVNKEKALLYVLIEHQSRPDRLMAFRMQFYLMQALKRHVIQNKGNPLPLPLIWPVLLYNGKRPYRYSRDMFSLFGDLEPLARKAFLEPFTLIDVGQIPKEDIRKHQLAGLMELSLCHADLRNLVDEMSQFGLICQDLRIEITHEIVEVVVQYCMKKRKFSPEQVGEYIQIIEQTLPENTGEVAMNIAQAFEAKGKAEGVTNALLAMELLEQGKSLEEVERQTDISIEILKKMSAHLSH